MLSFSRTPRASGQEGYTLSRRNFLIATIEGSIVLGYARSALAAAEFPLDARRTTTAGDLFEPTIWYSIGRDGRITVNHHPGGNGPACRYRARPRRRR